jgi:hypothetical protein
MRSPAPSPEPRRLTCARCGATFACGLSAECWCAAEPKRLPLPGDKAEDCLCPACLRKAAQISTPANTPK